ncbi:hypothetical protein CDAR_445851 [Caerostris darwini]|uniref:Uncharacterized protein n=1 Tax=Caerostris darwini TaxID=1538125 RepID=A0AAV4U0H3_9ARAC|nr:hypothetical protein CDAR_445851 [Caerostris darwini]
MGKSSNKRSSSLVALVTYQRQELVDILPSSYLGDGGVERGGVQQLKVLIPPDWKENRPRKENPFSRENHHPSHAMPNPPHGIFWNVRRAERIAMLNMAELNFCRRHSFRPLTSGTEGWNGGGRVQQLKVLIPPEWKESRSRKENPICQENHHPSHSRCPPHGIFWNVPRAERIAT